MAEGKTQKLHPQDERQAEKGCGRRGMGSCSSWFLGLMILYDWYAGIEFPCITGFFEGELLSQAFVGRLVLLVNSEPLDLITCEVQALQSL